MDQKVQKMFAYSEYLQSIKQNPAHLINLVMKVWKLQLEEGNCCYLFAQFLPLKLQQSGLNNFS